jgi:hypothetical protein
MAAEGTLLGRRDDEARLAGHIRACEPVIVYGLAGVGKSALVEAVYGSLGAAVDRCAVDCDRDDTAQRAAQAMAVGLGVAKEDAVDPVKVRDALRAHLQNLTRVTLIVLDNFESVWEGDRVGAYDLLEGLLGTPNLAIIVALRASQPPSDFHAWKRIGLSGLDRDAAVELFGRLAGDLGDEQEIADLVDGKLEGVPLAIELVARAARGRRLVEVREEVERILLGTPLNPEGGRGSSLEASLAVSVRHLDRPGRRLLALLGVLPAGIARADLDALSARLDGLDAGLPAERLCDLGLAYRRERDERLRTLKPIRDYSAYAHWPTRTDLDVVRGYYLELVSGNGADPSARRRRMIAENPNFISMARTLPDRIARCEALIAQGSAELVAGDSADARETFRTAAAVARSAREPHLLAEAALGLSGGLEGPGHTLDRADEQRLALLREAAAVLDDGDELTLRVLVRLLGELHFDASRQADREVQQLRERAARLDEANAADRMQFALLELATTDPEESLQARVDRAEDVVATARAMGDLKTEVKARQLEVSFLLEDGRNDAAEAARAVAYERIPELSAEGDRNAANWQDGVIGRAQQLFRGEFDDARRELEDQRPEGDPADSPYRRWLHQNVLLTLETGVGADPQSEDELARRITEVEELTKHLAAAECQKFGLQPNELDMLAYEWWPTWRVTLALLRAGRGTASDQTAAHETIRALATRPLGSQRAGSGGRGDFFDRILKHEYYVQVLALAALTLQRLTALANGAGEQDPWLPMRKNWATALDRLLTKFAGRAVVPGSGVMNLGSVHAFTAMAKGSAEAWDEVGGAFDAARHDNERLGARPALVRTLVADAETHRLIGSAHGLERAQSVAQDAAERARDLGMGPWRSRAEAVLEQLPTS